MISFDIILGFAALASAFLAVRIVQDISRRHLEMARFQYSSHRWWSFMLHDLRRYAAYRASIRTIFSMQSALIDRETRRLQEAGISSISLRSRYLLAREVLLVATLFISSLLLMRYEAWIAALLIVPVIVAGVWGPHLWLYQRWRRWQQRLDVEQLFLVEMVHVGLAHRLDPIRILHEFADVIGKDTSGSALARELSRARWREQMGGTLDEGLRAIPVRIRQPGGVSKMQVLADALKLDPGDGFARITALKREAYSEYARDVECRGRWLVVMLATAACVAVLGLVCCMQAPFTA